MAGKDIEAMMAALVSITAPPDWGMPGPNSAGDQIITEARQRANKIFRDFCDFKSEWGDHRGFVMRGLVMAIADNFQKVYLERGMASTMRGVRNAFATRREFLDRHDRLSVDNTMRIIQELVKAGIISLPDDVSLAISVVPKDPEANFECDDCRCADPGDCMKAGHCVHRDGPVPL